MATGIAKRFTPLLDRVLVQRLKPEAKTASGLFLPESAAKAPNYATVLAVGPGGRTRDGDILPMNVKVGDKVVVPEYGGMTLKFEDEEFQVFRDADIMGILNE
uniref:Hsp10 n=1 Tax=Crypthecodinium cohnii TaxID=2866 RepID=Q8S4Q9_CRYCO|nr:Hsp10 [Crypthecodinium cohnii]